MIIIRQKRKTLQIISIVFRKLQTKFCFSIMNSFIGNTIFMINIFFS